MPELHSYKNKSTDLLCKSIDWFLFKSNTGIQWVNLFLSNVPILYSLKKPVWGYKMGILARNGLITLSQISTSKINR